MKKKYSLKIARAFDYVYVVGNNERTYVGNNSTVNNLRERNQMTIEVIKEKEKKDIHFNLSSVNIN
jgi:hypothetical protein